jgi:hypothetical protein
MNHEIAIEIKRERMRREDYSRMVRFVDERLFSSRGFPPCPPWPCGLFLEEEDKRDRNDGSVYEWVCRAPEAYFISSGDASGVMTGQHALMEIPNGGFFPWMRRVFSSK